MLILVILLVISGFLVWYYVVNKQPSLTIDNNKKIMDTTNEPILSSGEQSDRVAPKRVAALVVGDVRYEGEVTRTSGNGQVTNSGTDHVKAFDVKTNNLLWDKKIYTTVMVKGEEEDAQWNFITSITLENQKLIVANEKGERYEVDMKTGDTLGKI